MYDIFQGAPPTEDAVGEFLPPKMDDLRDARMLPMITRFPLIPVVMHFVFL